MDDDEHIRPSMDSIVQRLYLSVSLQLRIPAIARETDATAA